MKIRSEVTRVPPASSAEAASFYKTRFAFETDCWDVHHAITNKRQDFVLLDVRSPELFAQGHLPKAINLPRIEINEERMGEYPPDTVFVTYCAGPHCNGSTKAAVALAEMGRPVKEMIGGVEGWKDEGFSMVK